MKKYFLTAAAALLFTGFASIAQDKAEEPKPSAEPNKSADKSRLKEYDEIVIKRKDPKKDTKVVIEIKDDEVIVDGKPIDQYVDEELSVLKRNVNKYRLVVPGSPFRNHEGDWEGDFHENFNEDIIIEGDEERAFLGVSTEGSSGGAVIINVSENSAAAKAGLKKDDVITKINDKAVFDPEQLSNSIRELKPNDKVTITYKRDGKENKTTATLGKRKMPVMAARPPRAPRAPRPPRAPEPPMIFNFDDHEFDLQLGGMYGGRQRLGIKAQDTEDGKGVKVIGVTEGSAAEKAGIRENDVITSFEGKDVNGADQLAKAARESKDKSTLKVQLNRNGKPQTVEIKVPKKLKTANL